MKAYEYNENFKKWYGFDENGIGYVFLENSYENKDTFKAMGAKWNIPIKAWIIDHAVSGYELIPISIDDIYNKGIYGRYEKYNCNEGGCEYIAHLLTEYKENKIREEVKNKGIGFVGTIGEKIITDLILDKCFVFYNNYSYYNDCSYKYIFHDIDGNVFVWSTSKELDDCADNDRCIIKVKGKIKEHREYKGIPQTILTRCEILNYHLI